MSSSTTSNQPQTFNPDNVPKPPPTYNQVAVTPFTSQTRFITLAGQTGTEPSTGRMISDDIVTQARQAYANIHNALKAAGATPRDIVHVRHYIVDRGNSEVEVVERGWGNEWIKFMDREAAGHRPPDTVLGVASLAKKDILYECEVWAVVNGGN